MNYHIYADDTHVYCSVDLLDMTSSLEKVKSCVADIRTWMIQNKLKINDDKTEFLLIKSAKKEFTGAVEMSVGQDVIPPSHDCRNLGVMFDDDMSMESHVTNICRSTLFQLRNIRRIRPMLNDSATAQLIHALITSKRDYCNALLYGIHGNKLKRLQRIQNIAARIVAKCPKSCHITPVLKDLHWLPIKERIDYKLLLLMYRVINNTAPVYLSELVKDINHERQTRSMTKGDVQVPRTNLKSCGDRAFSVCGPRKWNKLSLDIRQAPSLASFKTKLKTSLFKSVYDKQ